jgi:hypothetical protein
MLVCKAAESLADMERFDNVSNTWTVVAKVVEGRYVAGAVTINKSASPAEEQDQQILFDMLIAKSAKYDTKPMPTAGTDREKRQI